MPLPKPTYDAVENALTSKTSPSDLAKIIGSLENEDTSLKDIISLAKTKMITEALQKGLLATFSDGKEENNKNDISQILPVLLAMKEKNQIDDETFKRILLFSLMGSNPMMALLMMNNGNGNGSKYSKRIKLLKKKIEELEALLTKSKEDEEKEELKRKIEELEKQIIEKQTAGGNNNDVLTALLTTLVNNLLEKKNEEPKENPVDLAIKLAELMNKPQETIDNQLDKIAKLTQALRDMGLVTTPAEDRKLKLLEKKLEIQQELTKQRLEAEKQLKQMELEKQKYEAQAAIVQAENQAKMIKGIGDLLIKGAVSGLLNATKPATQQAQQAKPQPPPPPPPQVQPPSPSPPQPTPSPQQPPQYVRKIEPPQQEEEKGIQMIDIAHVDQKGEVLHEFKLPVDIVKQAQVMKSLNGNCYMITCPYDQEKVCVPEEAVKDVV
ncbi:hypothetical protein [Los Azufres archaeal virus 1]|nr:hypothetical protein [Los Azufres archaeal virus 1]